MRKEILRMEREDAEERARLAEHLPESAAFQQAVERLAKRDRARAVRLETLVTTHGLPLPKAVGEEATTAFLALMLRQDVPRSLQDEVLRRAEEAHRGDRIGGSRLAIFTDQLRMMRNEPQLYGTQLLLDLEMGTLRPYPIEDEAAVDERRRGVGLGPFADYLRRMRARVEGG